MSGMFQIKIDKNFIKYTDFYKKKFSYSDLILKNGRKIKVLTIFGFRFYFFDFSEYKILRKKYKNIIKRLRKKNKIKVLFLINDISKWKVQSLYDLMQKSKLYEPVVAITIADLQLHLEKEEKINILNSNAEFFKNRGIDYVFAYDAEKESSVDLSAFEPDIVFYQQPWGLDKIHAPQKVSDYALTCYIPYYISSYGVLNMDCMPFHTYLFRHYVLNKSWEKIYKKYTKPINYNIYGIGHTMLDEILYQKNKETENKEYVIYAPHWSIKIERNYNQENLATFLSVGPIMLDYARKHPEINWVFKPHPTLRKILKNIGWHPQMIDDYYAEWESFAKCCYDSSYVELFSESKALITDSVSFLTEYFCMRKPTIHLISPKSKLYPAKPAQKIFNTFYQAKNPYDLMKYLDDVVIKNNDRKKQEREAVFKELGFENTNAAKNIIENLTKAIKGKKQLY